jgi:hypothetical protein
MKINSRKSLITSALPLCFLLGASSSTLAATRWSDPATWPDNKVPAAGEQVEIASGQ